MEPNTLWKSVNPEKTEPKTEPTKTYQEGAKPNPVRSDGYVLQRFVPCASYDTPEEILEHYTHMWVKTAARYNRTIGKDRAQLYKDMEFWREMHKVAQEVVMSHRFAMGSGTLIPVKGRSGGHNSEFGKAEIPLTTPGVIHLWNKDKTYNILCSDDACAGESAVESLEYVTCETCKALGKGYF